MSTEDESAPSGAAAAFSLARTATDRGAWGRYLQSQGADTKDEVAVAAAAVRFRTLPLLLAHEVITLAHQALEEARGPTVDENTKFPLTIWGGAFRIDGGYTHDGVISDFIELLQERAQMIAAKREGLVVEPTTTTDGRRTNESTIAMYALFLDCDGTGTWDQLLAVLMRLDYAFIAYQSGGWTPGTPKWRVVIPLSTSFDTSTETKQLAWKAVYNHARVVFGAVGGLLSIGFDPATETPCCPWFLTEKRNETDPLRQIVWRKGHSLDALALVLALPAVDEITPTAPTVRPHLQTTTLSNERFEEIVSVLTAVTTRIPANRRDLYMALPGVLLDRGLEADDVLSICETVSARYPRPHPEKHADNLHCAKTTISKWDRDDRVTRIGTLNRIAPQIARAVDEVVPDPDKAEFLTLARLLARRSTSAPPPPTPATGDVLDAPAWEQPVDLKMLRTFAVKMRRKKGQSDNVKDAVHWILLDRLLKKKTLASPLEKDAETQLGREDALYRLMGLLAFRFPRNTPVEIVIEMLRPSMHLTLTPNESADKWLQMASRWYELSLASRLEQDAKREAEMERERQQRIREARACAL
jgi:hypothetical protein